jgi:CRISPR-associated protein Cst2
LSKVVQISILAKIAGNVNADEVIGTRITLKKMYSSTGEVLPFVSARAIKFAIRHALKEKGFEVDPFYVHPEEALRLADSAKPHIYVDNDLFGYMRTIGGERSLKRQAPIGISYLKALKDTPVKAEFAARFPRPWGKEESPAPFEIEVAEFIGRVNCIMYDYIGNFRQDRKIAESIGEKVKEAKLFLQEVPEELPQDERKKRIKAFTEIFLTPTYVLPRRTNSLNIPEYISSIIVLSERGPLPIYQYMNFDFNSNNVDTKSLEIMMKREEIKKSAAKVFLVDYFDNIQSIPEGIEKVTVSQAIEKIVNFL